MRPWAAEAIAPAGIHFLCIAMIYKKPNKLENHKSNLFSSETSASVLILEFLCFELQNIYKQNPNPIRIPIFSSELASSFIDSGAGLVLSVWFVLASVKQSKQIYSCKANSLRVVWCCL